MKKNLFYQAVYRRRNPIGSAVLNLLYGFASYPRLMLEVFLRKNLGERYFSTATAITLGLVLIFWPILLYEIPTRVETSFGRYWVPRQNFWGKYGTWYLFIAAYMVFGWLRTQEVQRNPSVFDFGRFSLSTGDIHPFFFNLFGQKPNPREIETFYEPLLFFVSGVLLWLLGQKVGILLTWSSVFYSLSYVEAYRQGDEFVMDQIDEMILNEEMQKAFVEDANSSDARGVRFYATRPTDQELRQKLADSFVADNDEPASAH